MEMDPSREEAEKMFARGRDALAAGEIPSALALLERALKLSDNRSWYSYLGYCMAKERGQVKKGIELCGLSLELEPEQADHYLHLAKIHLLAGNKKETLRVLREGMAQGENQSLIALLDVIGTRNAPVLSFLARSNPVNRLLGIFLERLRLR
jgi:tetratricopeptide (TPR) repeat protein